MQCIKIDNYIIEISSNNNQNEIFVGVNKNETNLFTSSGQLNVKLSTI